MAALFHKFTMRTGAFLLLLAALTCGQQAEENALEELEVETLVSGTQPNAVILQ